MSKKLTMTLSDETIEILKNFGSINQNILIKKGNVLQTMASMKNILGYAEVEETFPRDFGLYDVNEFLGILKTIKDPVLDFSNDEYLVIENAGSKMKYCYSDPSILVTVPDGFKPPPIDITVMMSEGSFTNLRKISKKNDLPDVIVHTDGTNCYMTASERRNATSNEFTVNVTPKSEETIDCLVDHQDVHDLRWKVDNLKFLPDDYEIGISFELVSYWLSSRCSYWIALEDTKPKNNHLHFPVRYKTDDVTKKWVFDWEATDADYEKQKLEINDSSEEYWSSS